MSLELVEQLHEKLYQFYSDHKYVDPCKKSQHRYNLIYNRLIDLDIILEEIYIPGNLIPSINKLDKICNQLFDRLNRTRYIYQWEFEIHNDIYSILQLIHVIITKR